MMLETDDLYLREKKIKRRIEHNAVKKDRILQTLEVDVLHGLPCLVARSLQERARAQRNQESRGARGAPTATGTSSCTAMGRSQ